MLRLTEVLLFIAPFAAFLLWRRTAPAGGPSASVLLIAVAAFMVLVAALAWFAANNSMGRTARYVPARLEDGRVVPGHAAP